MVAKTTPPNARQFLGQGLASVATRMGAEDAAKAAITLIQAMQARKTQLDALQALAQGRAAVATRMEAKDAAKASTALVQAMTQAPLPFAEKGWAQSLAAIAARMETKDAGLVAVTLTHMLGKSTDTTVILALSHALAAVAPYLGAKDVTRAATAVIQIVGKSIPAEHALFQGLAALLGRMEPGDAAATLTQLMDKPIQAYMLGSFVKEVSSAATRMKSKDAAIILTHAMSKTTDSDFLRVLAESLSTVATRLEPEDAATAAATLIKAMAKATDPRASYPGALQQLNGGLSSVAPRLDAKGAADAAKALFQAMTKTAQFSDLSALAQGLSAVTVSMEQKEAANICAEAVRFLIQAMARGMFISQTPPEILRGLEALLIGVDPPELARRDAAVAAAVATPFGMGHPVAALALLAPALNPLPCRLSTQELVELLKHPTCLEPARRVILDQLENRYHHKFADHWAFVRFAKQQKLDLDFTTPPKRTARATSVE